MKVLHLCLASYYIENSGYQESMVAVQNAIDGHEVYVIASTLNCKDGFFFHDKPIKYTNKFGVNVEIVPYSKLIPRKLNNYLRKYQNLKKRIENIDPDIIVVHGAQSIDLSIVEKYAKFHKKVKIVIDNHAAYYNSAKNAISKYVLHKFIYKHYIKRCEKYVDAIFAIGLPEKNFFHEMYSVDLEKISILRLPGNVEDEAIIQNKAKILREKLGLENRIILMHSGRMNKEKGTDILVRIFDYINPDNCFLILAGSLSNDIKDEILPIINKNERIIYLGWTSANELENYLCLTDYYIQHTDVTATVQQAMCKECGVILSGKIDEYRDYIQGNGFLVNNSNDLEKAIRTINNREVDFDVQKKKSLALAKKYFDIRIISKVLIMDDFVKR